MTTNLVYMIECAGCHKQYIGSTASMLKTRYSGHKSKIRYYVRRSLNEIAKKDKDHEALIKHFRNKCGQELDIFNKDNWLFVQPIDCIKPSNTSDYIKDYMINESKLNQLEREYQAIFNLFIMV